MFQYFHLLAPVLGDDVVFQNVDGTDAEATLQPFMDQDSDLCRAKCQRQLFCRFFWGGFLTSIIMSLGTCFFFFLDEEPSTSLLLPDQGRKMTWSYQETRTLLGIWGEDGVQQTLRGCLKNRHVFDYIAGKMCDHGFVRTSEQCYTRVKRLKHAFQHERSVSTSDVTLCL